MYWKNDNKESKEEEDVINEELYVSPKEACDEAISLECLDQHMII